MTPLKIGYLLPSNSNTEVLGLFNLMKEKVEEV
jgi:hypothetical protein